MEEYKIALFYREAHDCSLVMLPTPRGWNDKEKDEEQKLELSERAHTLNAGIAMPYEKKVDHARKVLRHALEQHKAWSLSFSGGKDSTVLSHLATTSGIILPHVFSNTRMEYPETLKAVASWFHWLAEHGVPTFTVFPDVRPKDLWKEIGVPLWSKNIAGKYAQFLRQEGDGALKQVPAALHAAFRELKGRGLKVSADCCNRLKKKPLKKWQKANKIKGAVTGVRACESKTRRLTWIMRGALYKTRGKWIANPLAFWTSEDVFRYMAENGITPPVTSSARGGSGCVTCMFGCHMAEKNSMQELAERNPRMHEVALDDWGYRPVLDALGIPYSAE